ncbi:hypothetical protein TNCV_2228791 [Trichonephila clavipes]|nr:hypothetical protein TNCV_2228791 [Trichonephila clavipes]
MIISNPSLGGFLPSLLGYIRIQPGEPNSPPCTLSLKDYPKFAELTEHDLAKIFNRNYSFLASIVKIGKYNKDLPFHQAHRKRHRLSTTEVILASRQPCQKDLANIKDSTKLISLTKTKCQQPLKL